MINKKPTPLNRILRSKWLYGTLLTILSIYANYYVTLQLVGDPTQALLETAARVTYVGMFGIVGAAAINIKNRGSILKPKKGK